MIETIETEVNAIEDAILKMHSGESDSEDESEEESDHPENVFVFRKRSKSMIDHKSGPRLAKSVSSSVELTHLEFLAGSVKVIC